MLKYRNFKNGNRVKVVDKYDIYKGETGTICSADNKTGNYFIQLDNGHRGRYWYEQIINIKNEEEYITDNMTDTEIAKMVDKTHILEAEEGRILTEHGLKDGVLVNKNDIIIAIALAYKKGYLRAKKGRSFKIGDKKCK